MTTDVLSDTDVSLKVVSNASGRMRVCVTGFNVDAVRAVAIEETVSQVTGVHAVHAYPRTASVVIWYSPELGDTAAVLSAITKAQHVPAELVPARAPHSAGVAATPSQAAAAASIDSGPGPEYIRLEFTSGGKSPKSIASNLLNRSRPH